MTKNFRKINWLLVWIFTICALGMQAAAQDKSFILLGDTHFDKLSLHDMVWLQQYYPNDISQINNYSQITQNNFSALISELLHQSQVVTPAVAGLIQTGDLQEGLAGNLTLATQMAIDARDSLRASSFTPPWILVKGNHEVTGDGGAQAFNNVILPFVSSELGQSINKTSYACHIGDVHIIVLDCYDTPNLLSFLRDQLSNSTAKFKVIATHEPVIPVTARLWHIFQDDTVRRDSLLNLIAMYKAIVVCGHLHKYSVVKRSTPYGPILQIMTGSVISNRDKHTPDYYVTTYGPSLVDLEPTYDNRGYLTAEAPYVTDFRMAEMQGYAVLSLNSTTGGKTLKFYAGLGEYLYETVNLNSYQLRIGSSGSGAVAVTPNDSVFFAGTRVQIFANPDLGWKFDGWSGDVAGTTNPDTVLMDADKNVTATFSQIPAGLYEIRVKIVGSGTVVAEPAGPYYSSGTVVTLHARAAVGNKYKAWTGDINSADTVVAITVDGHKSLTATFAQLESFKLNVRSTQHGSILSEPAGGTYLEGTQVTLTAQPETGWIFYRWLGDINGTTSPQVVTVDKPTEVKGVFREVDGSVQVFGATHDSYVQGFLNASKNFNGDSCLRVREGSSDINRYRSYVQFDVNGVTGNVLGAVLKMRVRNTGLPDGRGIKAGVYAVSTDSWTETTLKWSGAPAAGTLIDSTTVSMAGMYYGWDVGSYVAGEVAADKLVSVMLKDYSAQDKRIDFERREDGQGAVLEVFTDTPTGVEKKETIPKEFALHQNYPNPFNPTTTIRFGLSKVSTVSLSIYDVLGRKVALLIERSECEPGYVQRIWDGKNSAGNPAASGLYIYKLTAIPSDGTTPFVQSRKMELLK
jgi:uncharacterized repeat protein (TIGR02543 family)